MRVAPLGNVPVFDLFPGPRPLPGRDLPAGPLPLAPRCRRTFRRKVAGWPSARKTMPGNAAGPRIATTAVRIIPVVGPRSSAFDVLTSGGGYTSALLRGAGRHSAGIRRLRVTLPITAPATSHSAPPAAAGRKQGVRGAAPARRGGPHPPT